MFTSRAEYRILLRQDNADQRLTERSYRIGLADKVRYEATLRKYESVEHLSKICENTNVTAAAINDFLISRGSAPLSESKRIADIATRPELNLGDILRCVPRGTFDEKVIESVEINLKYKGYIQRERQQVEKLRRLEDLEFPEGFDFDRISGLTIECRQKFKRYVPRTIGLPESPPPTSPSIWFISAANSVFHVERSRREAEGRRER